MKVTHHVRGSSQPPLDVYAELDGLRAYGSPYFANRYHLIKHLLKVGVPAGKFIHKVKGWRFMQGEEPILQTLKRMFHLYNGGSSVWSRTTLELVSDVPSRCSINTDIGTEPMESDGDSAAKEVADTDKAANPSLIYGQGR